eukprot:gene16771-21394_t
MARSVINQEYTGDINIIRPPKFWSPEYTGDINIIRPPKFWSPAKILSELGQEDIDELIDTGERTAWPKVEMVRTQTAISRALEGILAKLDKHGAEKGGALTMASGALVLPQGSAGAGAALYVTHWLPAGLPKAVALLAHGYAEHAGRYEHVAKRLTDAGYAVYAVDHW